METDGFKNSNQTEEINTSSHERTQKSEKCEPFQKYIEVECLARAYVPLQRMCDTFCVERSLKNGTVFPELYRPYNADSKRRRYGEPDTDL